MKLPIFSGTEQDSVHKKDNFIDWNQRNRLVITFTLILGE